MAKPDFRRLHFQSVTAASGSAAVATFVGKPGKRIRIISINASTLGGTGTTPLTVSGLEPDPNLPSTPQIFDVDIPVTVLVTPNVSGLIGKDNTDVVVTLTALASSVPKLNVAAIEEPFNA